MAETSRKPHSQTRSEWEVVKTFEDAATGLRVEVSRLPLRFPKFNLSVLGRRGDGSFGRFLQVDARVENAVAVVAYHGQVVGRLLDEATLYVQGRLQEVEDEEIRHKQEREFRQLSGGPKKVAGLSKFTDGSKTEREAAKRARHESNLAARREVDRERTHNTKGKS